MKKGTHCQTPVLRCEVANPCQNGATCTGGVGDQPIYCTCPFPYTDSVCSTELTLCEQGVCKNNATCTLITQDQYKCTCQKGFSGSDCSTRRNLLLPNK